MKKFEEKKFNVPALKGISADSVAEHIKLYAGYVKHSNLILEKIAELTATAESAEQNVYALNEMQRRFGFEFDGMRNHEYYFAHLEGAAQTLEGGSALKAAIVEEWGSFETWLARFKAVAMTRGIGWAILSYDAQSKRLVNSWIDEQHLGHLTGLWPVLALDMWEHSFVADYKPSGKKAYVEDFFANLNWQTVEKNFSDASAK
ncbi:MAG: Fe-Mn family superoxide dismutase [Candidatus Paceibacterota bacterium]